VIRIYDEAGNVIDLPLVWLTSALLTVLSAVVPPISMLAPTDVSGNTCEGLLGHIAQRDGDLLYISYAHQERKTVRA